MNRWWIIWLLLGSTLARAEAPLTTVLTEIPKTIATPSTEALQADWTFSGIATAESGETFYYYFELQKNAETSHAVAALIDIDKKQLLAYENLQEPIKNSTADHWRAGRAFLNFNPITHSWIFGLKNNKQSGFHFKVDLFNSTPATTSAGQSIREGMLFSMNPTGSLNGHLRANAKEFFITAPKSWFRQIWVTKPQTDMHQLLSIICPLNDGQLFYAVHLKEKDAQRGAMAGLRNSQGEPQAISQFVTIEDKENKGWSIDVLSPSLHFTIDNALPTTEPTSVVIGPTKGLPGFCALNTNITFGRLGLGPTK